MESRMTLNDATGTSHEENEVDFTPGEVVLLAKLDQLEELIQELVEKICNLNLYENEGFRIDS